MAKGAAPDGSAQAHASTAYSLAYRLLGDASAAARVAEAALRLAYHETRGHSTAAFETDVLRAVVRACRDRLPGHERRPPARRPAGERWPAERADQKDRERLVEAGILTLPADERVVLVLADALGGRLSYQQIAGITGLSRDAVGTHLGRARAHLRDYLLLG